MKVGGNDDKIFVTSINKQITPRICYTKLPQVMKNIISFLHKLFLSTLSSVTSQLSVPKQNSQIVLLPKLVLLIITIWNDVRKLKEF
jgi:hypothetical protein